MFRLVAAALAACFAVAPAAAADEVPPTVAELAAALPSCESIDTCPPVRALIALGPAALWPALSGPLGDPDELVRFWVLGVLSEVPIPAAREAVTERLSDSAIRVRAAAAFALGALADRASTPDLLRALTDDDLNVRFAAAVALGALKDPAAVMGLIAACRDQDEDVRAYAAAALGETQDKRATLALLERLDEDINPQVRGYAAMALAQVGDPTATPALRKHLVTEKDAKALAATVYALGALDDRQSIGPIEALLHHPDPTVRQYATEALARLRRPATPAPAEPAPAEPPPAEPAEPAPTKTKPAKTKPAKAKPAKTKPAKTKPTTPTRKR